MKLNKVECKQLVKLREAYLESNSPITSKTMTPEKETNAVNAFKKYSDFLMSLGKKYGFNVADIDTIYDDGEIVFKEIPGMKDVRTKVDIITGKGGTLPANYGSYAGETLPHDQICTADDVTLVRKMNRFFVLTNVRIMKYHDGRQFKCPNCDKTYGLASEFMDHIQSSELEQNDIGNYVLKKRPEIVS